jgi:site-specific DNA recombinase
MEHKKQVGIWIRVSTDDQAKGDSPQHHEKRGSLYAEAKGWDVVTVYHLEALTGKSVMGYAETKRMLEDIRSGTITGLIFSKLARFARNTKELLEFADIFREEDAALISLEEAIDTSTPAGRLFYTMIAAMAQWEREEIVSRVVASIPIRAKMGKNIGGHPSLGYKWEGKEFVIDEKHAPVRKLIYELFLKQKRKKAIARTLNEQGYRTRSGGKFTDTTVARLLRDPTAKGERRLNHTNSQGGKKAYTLKPVSEWVTVTCPAIISAELWDECNSILDQIEKKRTRQGPQTKTLLAGYVQCATCQKKMYVYHKTQTPSYTCTKCKTRIHVEDLDFIFKGELKEFLLTETSVSQYLEKIDSELQEKEKLLSVVQEERGRIKKTSEEMVKMRVAGEWSKEMFIEHFKPLEERIMQLDNQMPELEAEIDFMKIQHRSSDVVLSEARDLYSRWDLLEFEEKRTIVEIITDVITVGKQDINMKLSYMPIKNTNANTRGTNVPLTTKEKNEEAANSIQNPVKSQRFH